MKWREPREWDWEEYENSTPRDERAKDYKKYRERFLAEKEKRRKHRTLFPERYYDQ